MKLLKTIDEKFKEIGFVKVNENEYTVHYQRENKEYDFIQSLYLARKSDGKHLIQSYDENLTDIKGIGNTCVGLTMYEIKLCLKKMKTKGWEIKK